MNKNIQYKKLTDICEVITGEWGTEISENSQNIVSVIRTTNFLNNGKIDIENKELIKRDIEKNKIEQKQLKKGDIIIEKSGGSPNQPVGRVVFFSLNSNEILLCNNFTSILRIKGNINSKYVFYFLRNSYKNKKVLKFQNKTTGIINLKLQNYLDGNHIFLPELKIQNKIVSILDNLENIIEKNQNYLIHLRELTKSLFTKYSKNKKVVNLELEEICEFIKDGTHQTPTYVNINENGYKFLSSKDVSKGIINWDNTKYISEELHKELYKKIAPRKNDILLAKNGTTGVAALVDKEEIFDIYVSLAILRLKKEYNPKYILEGINSIETNQQFKRSLKGIGVPNLHLKEIKKVKIPIPSIELQNKFAERIEKIEKLKFTIWKIILKVYKTLKKKGVESN